MLKRNYVISKDIKESNGIQIFMDALLLDLFFKIVDVRTSRFDRRPFHLNI